MRLDLDELDRQAAEQHLRDRDEHREPRFLASRRSRTRRLQAELASRLVELADADAGVLQPPTKPEAPLNWPAVALAAAAIAKLADDASYTAPEDLAMHGNRIRGVCSQLGVIAESLLIQVGFLSGFRA